MVIALFGGSFDPFHIGHEEVINQLLSNHNIDKVVVVPTYLNPFKSSFHLSPNDRLDILNLLYDNNSDVDVLDFEIKQNKATPSIETVFYIKKLYKPSKIYLTIGSDNLESLDKWYQFDKLKKYVDFIVVQRDGYEVKNDIIQFKTINMDIRISSSKLRKDFDINYIPKKIQKKVLKIWNKE
ncbi:MAG: nicotinate (nicotinamide) nucleotide adenylyltransferase [Campylobacterota bacterium]|nr:nicotinate (nicotinamide) nucleotide adenylyltransferase [Campylobacterota bacterium]